LEELGLIKQFGLGNLLCISESFAGWFAANAIPSRLSETRPHELLVEEVFYPGLPFEERNVHLDCFLIQLFGVNGADRVHVGRVQFDALAS